LRNRLLPFGLPPVGVYVIVIFTFALPVLLSYYFISLSVSTPCPGTVRGRIATVDSPRTKSIPSAHRDS
jgi:hypothetical protein